MESKLSNSVLVFIGFVLIVHAVLVVESQIVVEVDKNEAKVPVSPPPLAPLKNRWPPPPRFKHGHSRKKKPTPPPPPKHKLNVGKKLGLLFAGIVAFMQICFAGFLVYKRRQLFWISRADRKNRA